MSTMDEIINGLAKAGPAPAPDSMGGAGMNHHPTSPVQAAIYAEFLAHVARRSESYKFIRMADDLHDVAAYLNEMRICFLLLTATVYIFLAVYFLCFCYRRNRRAVNDAGRTSVGGGSGSQRRTGRWDYQGDEYPNATTATTATGPNTDDLVSVRSDGHVGTGIAAPGKYGGSGAVSYMGRNARQAPSFMRHGHMNHHHAAATAPSPTTRLITSSEIDGGSGAGSALSSAPAPTKHPHQLGSSIPHIVTTTTNAANNIGSNGGAHQQTTQVETHLEDAGTQLIHTGSGAGLTQRHHRISGGSGGGGISGPNREQEIIATEM